MQIRLSSKKTCSNTFKCVITIFFQVAEQLSALGLLQPEGLAAGGGTCSGEPGLVKMVLAKNQQWVCSLLLELRCVVPEHVDLGQVTWRHRGLQQVQQVHISMPVHEPQGLFQLAICSGLS